MENISWPPIYKAYRMEFTRWIVVTVSRSLHLLLLMMGCLSMDRSNKNDLSCNRSKIIILYLSYEGSFSSRFISHGGLASDFARLGWEQLLVFRGFTCSLHVGFDRIAVCFRWSDLSCLWAHVHPFSFRISILFCSVAVFLLFSYDFSRI